MLSTYSYHYPLPDGQNWLISRGKELGYKLNYNGVCYGVTIEGVKAGLIQELRQYFRRMELINAIPVTNFRSYLDKVKDKNSERIRYIRLCAKQHFDQLPEEQKQAFEKKKSIQKKLCRTGQSVRDQYAQCFVDEYISLQKKDKLIKLEIETSFQNVAIQQNIVNDYHYLFKPDKIPSIQTNANSRNLTASRKLQDLGGMTDNPVRQFSGVYDFEGLKSYFSSIKRLMIHACMNKPLAFFIINSNHAMTVILNPEKGGTRWAFLNPSNSSILGKTLDVDISSDEMAYHVWRGFINKKEDSKIIFSTTIFSMKQDEMEACQWIGKLVEDEEWQCIHKITPEKICFKDHLKYSWLHFAAEECELDMVIQLLDAGAEIDCENAFNSTPLRLAVRGGACDVVHYLLANHANVFFRDIANGNSLLHHAVKSRNTNMVRLLLKQGIYIDAINNENATPLVFSALQEDVIMFNYLIQHGADINNENTDNVKLLFTAIFEKSEQIAKMVLVANIDVMREEEFSIASLEEAVNDCARRQALLDRLVHQKKCFLNQTHIHLRASEFAAILGVDQISELIREAETKLISKSQSPKKRASKISDPLSPDSPAKRRRVTTVISENTLTQDNPLMPPISYHLRNFLFKSTSDSQMNHDTQVVNNRPSL